MIRKAGLICAVLALCLGGYAYWQYSSMKSDVYARCMTKVYGGFSDSVEACGCYSKAIVANRYKRNPMFFLLGNRTPLNPNILNTASSEYRQSKQSIVRDLQICGVPHMTIYLGEFHYL